MSLDIQHTVVQLRRWAKELGFDDLHITDTDVSRYSAQHQHAIQQGLHGEMEYLERNQDLRYNPEQLLPGTQRIVCVRMNYLPDKVATVDRLDTPKQAYIARYALGRDYHKLMRSRLRRLAKKFEQTVGPFGYRAYVDSAPVLERQLAEKAGLGWIGKNTLLLNEQTGSWFFLGEIYTDLLLPVDSPKIIQHCGSCTRCMEVCPTNAFIKPWVLDARRCISYLTIEFSGSIPLEFRPLIGNRVFGCDDCQIFCPWTKFTQRSSEVDFEPRHALDVATLQELFLWSEQDFLKKTEGSAIRRIGYECWLRNLAVALGNAPQDDEIINALESRLNYPSSLVVEHVQWALMQQQTK